MLFNDVGNQFLRKASNYLLHYGQFGYNYQADLMPGSKLRVLWIPPPV